MRKQQREEFLINKAEENGFVSTSEAASALAVSLETIRRDIKKLTMAGLLREVRGGAEPAKQLLRKDSPYTIRLNLHHKERISIGQIAANMIQNNTVVGLDCGVSIQALASLITNVQNVTFVTNSLPIATILTDKFFYKQISGRLIFIGGEIDTSSRYSRGFYASNALSDYNFDQAFLSCTALSVNGASNYNIDECDFATQLCKQSVQNILLAESDKIGKNSVRNYADITDFDYIITDNKKSIPSDLSQKIRSSSTNLIVASYFEKS